MSNFEQHGGHHIPSIAKAGSRVELWGEWIVKGLRQRFNGNQAAAYTLKIPVERTVREYTAPPPPYPAKPRGLTVPAVHRPHLHIADV